MAISEFEIKRCEKLVGAYVEKHRPPAHIRNQVDLSFRVKDQSIEIFEIRPLWSNPDEKTEEMQAKTTYVKKNRQMESLLATRGSKMAQLSTNTRS